jgi:hypothetical protein
MTWALKVLKGGSSMKVENPMQTQCMPRSLVAMTRTSRPGGGGVGLAALAAVAPTAVTRVAAQSNEYSFFISFFLFC